MASYFGVAKGISAINTIKSITMSNDAEVSHKKTVSGYSGKAVKPIALRFISELALDERFKGLHISGMGGIETWRDALDFIRTTDEYHENNVKHIFKKM